MSSCIKKLKAENNGKAPDYVLVDGNRLPDDLSKEDAQFVIKVHILRSVSFPAITTSCGICLDFIILIGCF